MKLVNIRKEYRVCRLDKGGKYSKPNGNKERAQGQLGKTAINLMKKKKLGRMEKRKYTSFPAEEKNWKTVTHTNPFRTVMKRNSQIYKHSLKKFSVCSSCI